MVGRASRGQPWICGELAGSGAVPASSHARNQVALEHYTLMISHYGEDVGVRHARKHIGWYLDTLAPHAPASLKKAMMTSRDADQVWTWFSEALATGGEPVSVLENAA